MAFMAFRADHEVHYFFSALRSNMKYSAAAGDTQDANPFVKASKGDTGIFEGPPPESLYQEHAKATSIMTRKQLLLTIPRQFDNDACVSIVSTNFLRSFTGKERNSCPHGSSFSNVLRFLPSRSLCFFIGALFADF